MYKVHVRKYAQLVGLAVYSYFFWEEKFGINLVLFSFGLVALLSWGNRSVFASIPVKIALAALVISGLSVLTNNSAWAKFAHLSSFFVFTGFVHQPSLRTFYYALWHVVLNYVKSLKPAWLDLFNRNNDKEKSHQFLYYLRLSIVPVLFLVIFYILFLYANPRFEALSAKAWLNFSNWIGTIFTYINFPRILFTLMGFVLLAGIIYNQFINHIPAQEAKQSDLLIRLRIRRKTDTKGYVRNNQPFGLKEEYNAAVILVSLVNLLLLLVNGIDINWIWFGFEVPETLELKQFVHEGTYFLIASILLSMAIVLYFFRANINFYSRNRLLRQLCYFWMLQNGILVISVCLRNYYYLHMHGLAYKRLGVFFFLALTLFGLATMAIKLRHKKSNFYMMRLNTWAAFVLMVVLSTVDWDLVMARYNLAHWNKKGIDSDFYFTFSPKVMPLVYANLETVKVQIEANKQANHRWMVYQNYDTFKADLDKRKATYLSQQDQFTWLSWNLSDMLTTKKLLLIPDTASLARR